MIPAIGFNCLFFNFRAMSVVEKGYPFCFYAAQTSELSEEEGRVADVIAEALIKRRTDGVVKLGLNAADFERIYNSFNAGVPLKPEYRSIFEKMLLDALLRLPVKADGIVNRIYGKVYGYKLVQVLFDDDDLEEIMINGEDESIFVYHKNFGVCKTSIKPLKKDLDDLLVQMRWSGKNLDDLKLPDGSRANIIVKPISERTIITIRKFKKQKLSLIDLIEAGTLTSELASYLWLCVEGFQITPLNIIVIGGTACGKTTTLNALTSFIPGGDRIVSIEEVREVSLERDNWIALEAQDVGMDFVLRNVLRMRPDRIIVGEVRGSEAETLFNSMNVGLRGVLGTMHANNSRDAVKKLEESPMNVPKSMIPLLNVIVVQNMFFDRSSGKNVRRIVQVSEVSRLEEEITLNDVFVFNWNEMKLERTSYSSEAVERISKGANKNLIEVNEELGKRSAVLDYLAEKKITSFSDVNDFMSKYYQKD